MRHSLYVPPNVPYVPNSTLLQVSMTFIESVSYSSTTSSARVIVTSRPGSFGLSFTFRGSSERNLHKLSSPPTPSALISPSLPPTNHALDDVSPQSRSPARSLSIDHALRRWGGGDTWRNYEDLSSRRQETRKGRRFRNDQERARQYGNAEVRIAQGSMMMER